MIYFQKIIFFFVLFCGSYTSQAQSFLEKKIDEKFATVGFDWEFVSSEFFKQLENWNVQGKDRASQVLIFFKEID